MEVVGDRFALGAAVASGGMGVVHRAVDRETGKHVALKLMHGGDAAERLRFQREGEVLASLDHPAIVRHVAHGVTEKGQPYVAMEWIDGESLLARLARAGLTLDETVALGRRIADGLGHAHRAGVFHRDIKPSNIMLPHGDLAGALVVDFGVARMANPTIQLTATGDTLGTPAYMAPEQARGAKKIDARADVFSLGCVLYECLAGRRAFHGRNPLAVIAKVVLWHPPRIQTLGVAIPEALDELIATMMAKDTLSRPLDGAEVATKLAAFAPSEATDQHSQSSGAGERSTTGASTGPPVRASAPPTMLGNPSAPRPSELFACVIAGALLAGVDGTAEPLDEAQLSARRAVVDRCVAPVKISAEVLRDGSVVAVVSSTEETPHAIASRAVTATRALVRELPRLSFAICSGMRHERDSGEGIVDLTAAAIEKEAMAAIFAGVSAKARPAGAIRIDERTSALLPDEPQQRIAGASYVTST